MTSREGTTGSVDVGRKIHLSYQRFGRPDDPAVVLIAGLGQQMNAWPMGLIDDLVDRQFQVVRFDNRDVGQSTHLDLPAPKALAMLRAATRSPYSLADMARDTAGLIAALHLSRVHLVGVSMGAMIGQTVAAHYPDRVLSLTSISSTTGARRVGQPALSTAAIMLTAQAATSERQAQDHAVRMFGHIGSHGHPFDEPRVRQVASEAWHRDHRSDGRARQLCAILASGDRTAELAAIDVPTMVIHGDRDKMVHPSGGHATAAAIPGAHLLVLPGLGHDLPAPLWPQFAALIAGHVYQIHRRDETKEELAQ
jgi:pimeloyl-ACP methyl ester carboxylesterase